jgi:hypothetical protein
VCVCVCVVVVGGVMSLIIVYVSVAGNNP